MKAIRGKNVLFASLAVALALGALELACRALGLGARWSTGFEFYIAKIHRDMPVPYQREDPELLWGLVPGYRSADVSINADGFRDREHAREKPAGVRRVLCLGDSSTFGLRVAAGDAYPRVVGARLNAECAGGGVRYEVINAGVSGYTSAQALRTFETRGAAYSPDVVTLYVGINDESRRYGISDERAMRLAAGRRGAARLLGRSELYQALRGAARRLARSRGTADDGTFAPAGGVPRVPIARFRENVLRLDDACRARGARLVLISYPWCAALCPGGSAAGRHPYRATLEEAAGERGIPLARIPEMTEAAARCDADLFVDCVHPSPRGHARIADALLRVLAEAGIVSCAARSAAEIR